MAVVKILSKYFLFYCTNFIFSTIKGSGKNPNISEKKNKE